MNKELKNRIIDLNVSENTKLKLIGLFNKYYEEFEEMQQENKTLKENWNKLKNIAKSQSDFKRKLGNDRVYFETDELLEKMQELEKSDNNENN